MAAKRLVLSSYRTFLSSATQGANANRIFDPIRRPDDLHTLTLLSATANRPLVTLWGTSWCSTCQTVKPLIKSLVEGEAVGEAEGGLAFAEVEMDSTLIGDLPIKYMIASMPTLLAFSRQEPQNDTRLTKAEHMKDKRFLREWLIEQAKRGGRDGGGGGGMFGGLFGR